MMLWPVLPKDERPTDRLQMTQADFLDILPFPIAPMEVALDDVAYDGNDGTSATQALDHDRRHAAIMLSSWRADANYLGGRSRDDQTQAAEARRQRRELVRQVHRFRPGGRWRGRLEEILFNRSHELGAESVLANVARQHVGLLARSGDLAWYQYVQRLRYAALLARVRWHCRFEALVE